MANLPEDVMLDICVRLPVKSVGRFRCVSKTWYKLLKDHEFVQKHLDHATETNRLSLMLHSCRSLQDGVYTIHYDPSSSTCTGSANTNLPFASINNVSLDLQFHGYCNGLVCVSPYGMDVIWLWNPCTNEYEPLPDSPLNTLDGHDCYVLGMQCGFGYDNEIGEFKLVCLSTYSNDLSSIIPGSGVHLYTLGSCILTSLGSIPYRVFSQPDVAQVSVNGVVHWKAYRECEGFPLCKRVVLSFHFEKEMFEEMPWPDLFRENFRTELCVLGGSLCVFGFDPDIGVEVWELNCQVRNSWKKLFSIDMKKHFGLVKDFVPLQALKNGEFLFGFDTDVGFHVHKYDPKHDTSRLLFFYEDTENYSSRTSIYIESLVLLNSGNYVDDSDDVESDEGAEVDDVESDEGAEVEDDGGSLI